MKERNQRPACFTPVVDTGRRAETSLSEDYDPPLESGRRQQFSADLQALDAGVHEELDAASREVRLGSSRSAEAYRRLRRAPIVIREGEFRFGGCDPTIVLTSEKLTERNDALGGLATGQGCIINDASEGVN